MARVVAETVFASVPSFACIQFPQDGVPRGQQRGERRAEKLRSHVRPPPERDRAQEQPPACPFRQAPTQKTSYWWHGDSRPFNDPLSPTHDARRRLACDYYDSDCRRQGWRYKHRRNQPFHASHHIWLGELRLGATANDQRLHGMCRCTIH